MEQNIIDFMDGVYAPPDANAPFPTVPDLPVAQLPDVQSGFAGGGASAQGGMDDAIANLLSTTPTKSAVYKAFDPIPFNRKEEGFDPIYKSFGDGLYKKLGFLPGYDNEDIYANELGKSGQFWQGLKGIVPLAGMAHNEAWRSEADFWGGIFQGDLKKAFSLTMDPADLQRIYDDSKEVFDSNFVPLMREQRDSSFNMGKFSRGIQQFGFTAGTMLQFAEQTVGEMAIGALVGSVTGGTGLGASMASLGRRMAKTVKAIDKVYDMSHAYKKIMQFENTVMDATKLRKTFDYLKTAAKKSPVGSFQNFYRFSKEYNFAAAEARFERAQSYGDYIENKEREIMDKYDRSLTPEERELAEKEALEVSNANGVTNIALLYAMNRINMDNFLKMGWGMSSKIGKEAVEGIGDEIIERSKGNFISKLAGRLKGKPGKKAAKEGAETATEKAVKPDRFMAKKDVKRFSNEWWNGKGNDLYRWGTDSAWEGVQEIGQSTSAEYWQNYYNDKNKMTAQLKDNWGNLMSLGTRSLKKAAGSQFDREGFDTFLSGFIIGGPSAMINMATGKIQKAMNAEKFAARDNFVAERVKFLNDWARTPMQVLDPKLKTYADQTEIADGLNKAVKDNNPYAFHNLSRKGFQKAVLEGYNSGKLDVMFDMMDKATDELTDEEFKEAFGITDTATAITAETRKSAKEYVQQLKGRAGELVKTIEDVRTRAVNEYDYTKFKVGSEEYKDTQMKHMAWEAVLENYIFEKDANRDIIERYKGVLGKNQETLGATAYPAFYMFTNAEFIKNEVNSLRTEVMSMEAMGSMLSPDQREQLKAKRVELDTLQKWNEDFSKDPKQTDLADLMTQRRLEYFSKYINTVQKKSKADPITADALEEAFADLADLYRLDADKRQVFANLNFLADPKKFEGLFNMHYQFMSDMYKDRMKTLDERIANRTKVLDLLEDEEFKRKYAELHTQFVEAKFEGNNELAGIFLDLIYEQEFGTTEETTAEEGSDSTDTKADIERKKSLSQELISFVWERLAKKGITNADSVIGTRETIDGVDFDKFWSNVTKEDLQNLRKLYETKKLEQLDLYNKFKGEFDPSTGTITSNDTSFFDNKIKNVDAELAALEGAKPATATADDFLKDIAKETSEDKLLDLYQSFTDGANAKLFSTPETQAIVSAIYDRITDLQSAKPAGVTYASVTSPEFLTAYNIALVEIQKLVTKPDVTEKDVNDAFALLKPALAKISPTERIPFIDKHKAEKEALIQKIRENATASDDVRIKKEITAAFKPGRNIKDVVDEVFNIINVTADMTLKNELIMHFEQEFTKMVDQRIAELKKHVNTSGLSAIRKGLMDNAVYFRTKMKQGMEKYEAKAQELAEATKNITLTVEYDENWSNPVNRSIQDKDYDGELTSGQKAALRNLQTAKLVTQEEIDEVINRGSRKEGSELINAAIARGYALRLNKLANDFIKTGKTDALETELARYLKENGDTDATKAKDLVKFIKENFADDIDMILQGLEIPKTEILEDSQQKLLDEYLKTVYNLQFDVSLESMLSKLDEKKSNVLSGSAPYSFQDIFTEDFVSHFEKILKWENNSYNTKDVIAALEDAALQFTTLTDGKEGKAILDKLVDQFANPKRKFEARNIFSAVLNYALETEAEVSNPEKQVSVIQEAEMIQALNDTTTSLSAPDITELEQFAKTQLLADIKKTLNAAVGHKKDDIVYDPDLQDIAQDGASAFYSALRPKFDSDLRTTETLAKALEAEGGQTTAKKALQFIINSEFATDAEKELATQLLAAVGDDDIVLIDNSADMAGGFNLETKELFINLAAAGYKLNGISTPLETVILHELIHRFTDEALADPKSEYYKAIKALYAAAATNPAAKTFYAFDKEMQEDEKLYEFVAEAMTNPAFQYMLAKIPYANSKKSVWEKFVEILNNLLKNIGIETEENVLNEVINLTSDLITPNTTGQTLNDDVVYASEKMLKRITEAKTKQDLKEIRKDMKRMRKNGEFTASTYKALQVSVARKLKKMTPSDAVKYYFSSKPISIGNKTYRYRLTDNGLQVYYMTSKGPRVVPSNALRQAVVEKLVKERGGFRFVLSPADVAYIRDVAGDPRNPYSYASGNMLNEDPIGMLRFPKVYENRPNLVFKSVAEYKRFGTKYRAILKRRAKSEADFQRELTNLSNEFGVTAVKNFSELYYKMGSFANISKLIDAGAVSITGKGNSIEEVNYQNGDDSLYDYFDAVIKGENLNLTEEEAVRQDINKGLANFLGVNVDRAMQDRIENELLDPTLQDDTGTDDPGPVPPPTPDLSVEPFIVYSTVDPTTVNDPAAFDFAATPFEERKTAKEKHALRSVPRDLDKFGFPHKSFSDYYIKVRSIINKLSVKKLDDISDYHVALVKDNAALRWDGSAQDQSWSSTGVIGYIADEAGNPLVFNSQGEIIGKLDRNNLADDKGLNNGENQVVYFTTVTKDSWDAPYFEEDSFKMIISAREKAMAGQPQIAKLIKFTQGHMNNKVLVTPSDQKKNRADTRNPEFYDQLMQDHVSFRFSPNGKALLAVVADESGAENQFALFPVNTGEVRLKVKDGNSENDISLFDHLLDLMKTYNDMVLANPADSRLGDIAPELLHFVRNFWFTSDNVLKIPAHFKNINIKVGKETGLFNKVMWVKNNGVIVPGKEEDINAARNYLNRRPVNVEGNWLSGERKFLFPYTTIENGQKIVKFVEKDYKDFMFREIGMKSNVVEVKKKEDLVRYNSTVHFSNPQDLDAKTPPAVPTVEDIIKSDDAISSSVKDGITTAAKTTTPTELPKKNRFRKAPMLDKIYKKTCK